MRRRPLRRRSPARVASDVQLAAAKKVVYARSEGWCEARDFPHACTLRATQVHHVKRRSQGGSNDPANLVHLCTPGHMAVHANPSLAAEHGLLSLREHTP